MKRGKHFSFALVVLVWMALADSAAAQCGNWFSHGWCCLFGHHNRCPEPPAAGCNPCLGPQQTTHYVAETAYRQCTVCVPVTTYRPTSVCDPSTGQMVTTLRPSTNMLPQRRWVPYTTYRAVTASTTSALASAGTVTAGTACPTCHQTTRAAASPTTTYSPSSSSSIYEPATSAPAAPLDSGPSIYSQPDEPPMSTSVPSLGRSLPSALPPASRDRSRPAAAPQLPRMRGRSDLEQRFRDDDARDGRTAWRSYDPDAPRDAREVQDLDGTREPTPRALAHDVRGATGARLTTHERSQPQSREDDWYTPRPMPRPLPGADDDEWRSAR